MLNGQNIAVVDLETERSASELSTGWNDKKALGLSIGSWYFYRDDKFHWFDKFTLEKTVQFWVDEQTLLVSFNGISFDFCLCQALLRQEAEEEHNPSLAVLCDQFKILCAESYDILAAVWAVDPYRKFERGLNSLGAISVANGYGEKDMDGAQAPVLWRAGRYAEVITYCAGDVRKTRLLFEQIVATGAILRGDGQPIALPSPPMFAHLRQEVLGG